MDIHRRALIISIALACSAQASCGQAAGNALGDANTNASPDKIFGSTGNPYEVGDFSGGSQEQNTGTFVTRHRRTGNASGIGGSFLGTTDITSESSPARSGRIPENAVRALTPTAGVNETHTRLFSESLTEPVSTSLPELSPNISNRWNPALPSPSVGLPASTVNFFPGRTKSPASKTFSNTMSVPSFDSY